MNTYAFPLSVQFNGQDTAFLLSALTGKNKKGEKILKLLQKRGLFGVELNLLDFSKIKPMELADYLSSFNLKLTNIASGAYANEKELSLSNADSDIRKKTIDEIITMADYSRKTKQGAGIICGFIKGKAGQSKQSATEYFLDSLAKLDKNIREYKTPLLIEVTNRYESAVANTLDETVKIIKNFNNPYFFILPDTFHMNIEEKNIESELIRYKENYCSIHISDNNRHYPCYGAIDFYKIIRMLKVSGYKFGLAIEGNIKGSLEESINFSADYLFNISKRLEV